MRKIVVNLVNDAGDRNYDSYPKHTYLQNKLLLIIVDTTKNNLSHSEGK